MNVLGISTIAEESTREGYFVKCIITKTVALFFPGTIQHRDMKQGGASYEDDYRGNAMAATITPGRIDVRFHEAYTDHTVEDIFRTLLRMPEMGWATTFSVRYQGRHLLG